MTLGEKVIESLEQFRDDLQSGERIIVKTVERCGCAAARLSAHQSTCHICNGSGFVIDAKTLMPETE